MPISDQYADLNLDRNPDHYNLTNMRWTDRLALYSEYWKYFSGKIFDETDDHAVTNTGEKPKLYPLQLNLIEMACVLHASGILGDTSDRDAPIEVKAKPRKDRGGKTVADETTTAISDTFEESGLENFVDEQAMLYQVFGGNVWALRWDPPRSEMGVRVEKIWPEFFFPVWHAGSMDLIEVFLARHVDIAQAEATYNVDIENPSLGNRVYVVEHWTEREFSVTVDGEPARYPDGEPMQGANKFGIVPFEYFPRVRAGGFYGTSLIKSLMGIQNETNARMADLGDAISAGVHRILWIRNRSKGVKGLEIDPYGFLDLGMPATSQHPEPEVGAVDPPELPDGAQAFVDTLIGLFRTHKE